MISNHSEAISKFVRIRFDFFFFEKKMPKIFYVSFGSVVLQKYRGTVSKVQLKFFQIEAINQYMLVRFDICISDGIRNLRTLEIGIIG